MAAPAPLRPFHHRHPPYSAGPPTLAGKYFVSGTLQLQPPAGVAVLADDVDDQVGALSRASEPRLPYFEAPVGGGYARTAGALFLCEYAFSWPGAIFVGFAGEEGGDLFSGTPCKFERIEIAPTGLRESPRRHRPPGRRALWQQMAPTFTINHK